MSYQNVQFIGHAMNIGPKYDAGTGKYEYVGNADATADIAGRIALVRALLEIARTHAASAEDTLKVLMLPEFYFRGRRGAYTLDETHAVIDGLQALVKDEAWKHWFFVFGSVIAYSHADGVEETDEAEVYNIVPCQIGGYRGDAHEAARVIMKEHLSNIDFVRAHQAADDDAFVWERVAHLEPMDDAGSEVQFVNYGGEGVFDACGFKWGVEVCLDHGAERLRRSRDLPALAFQLIPSCGMSIRDGGIALARGWVFNVDGLNRGRATSVAVVARNAHSELLKVTAAAKTAIEPRRYVLGPLPNVDALYADGSGELHVYPPAAAVPV